MKANHCPPTEEEASRKAEEFIAELKKDNPNADRSDHAKKKIEIYLANFST